MSKRQDQFPDIVENEYFISWDDPTTETVSVGFLERSMVMDFDYAEFLEFAAVADQVREYINRARGERATQTNGFLAIEEDEEDEDA